MCRSVKHNSSGTFYIECQNALRRLEWDQLAKLFNQNHKVSVSNPSTSFRVVFLLLILGITSRNKCSLQRIHKSIERKFLKHYVTEVVMKLTDDNLMHGVFIIQIKPHNLPTDKLKIASPKLIKYMVASMGIAIGYRKMANVNGKVLADWSADKVIQTRPNTEHWYRLSSLSLNDDIFFVYSVCKKSSPSWWMRRSSQFRNYLTIAHRGQWTPRNARHVPIHLKSQRSVKRWRRQVASRSNVRSWNSLRPTCSDHRRKTVFLEHSQEALINCKPASVRILPATERACVFKKSQRLLRSEFSTTKPAFAQTTLQGNTADLYKIWSRLRLRNGSRFRLVLCKIHFVPVQLHIFREFITFSHSHQELNFISQILGSLVLGLGLWLLLDKSSIVSLLKSVANEHVEVSCWICYKHLHNKQHKLFVKFITAPLLRHLMLDHIFLTSIEWCLDKVNENRGNRSSHVLLNASNDVYNISEMFVRAQFID